GVLSQYQHRLSWEEVVLSRLFADLQRRWPVFHVVLAPHSLGRGLPGRNPGLCEILASARLRGDCRGYESRRFEKSEDSALRVGLKQRGFDRPRRPRNQRAG